MSRKSSTARLSIASNTLLIILKFVVGFSTGAVSIISEAIHSLMDLLAAMIAYISVKISDRPPDSSHPYGHEKMENISGVIETLLIFAASFMIIKEAVLKIIHGSLVESAWMGCLVMAVSATVNYFVSRKLYKVAREEGSVALEADALHLKADVYTSAGVAVGLLVLWITKLQFLDPIIAILIAAFILKEAWEMLVSAFGPLMDANLPEQDLRIIKQVVGNYKDVIVDFHELRTRRSGHVKHIDLHLTMPYNTSLKDFHDICDKIEREIENCMSNTDVLIHGEPCSHECSSCARLAENAECRNKEK